MDDNKIIEMFWSRDTDAITAANKKYGGYCFSVANSILRCQEDSEECVNDALLSAWNAIPPQRPANLQMFLAKITRNLSFDRFKARTAQKRGGGEINLVLDELAECLAGEVDVASEYEYKELGGCICRFVDSLPARDSNVFLRRYFFNDSVAEISARFDLTENHVMVLLSRTRKKLRQYLQKDGLIDG